MQRGNCLPGTVPLQHHWLTLSPRPSIRCLPTRLRVFSSHSLPREDKQPDRSSSFHQQKSAHVREDKQTWRYNASRAKLLTQDIKQERQIAVGKIRGAHTDFARVIQTVDDFCTRMLNISCARDINFIHASTLVHSTAAVWTAASSATSSVKKAKQQRQQCCITIQTCLSKLLHKADRFLPQMDTQAASNILWAFAKCGLNPDSILPGITARLLRVLKHNKKPAKAQELANAVWALATMHEPAMLPRATKSLTFSLIDHFLAYLVDPSHKDAATPQEVANLLWAIATLDLQPEPPVLEKLCSYFVAGVQQSSAKTDLQPQDISMVLLALHNLRFVPNFDQVSVMVTRFGGLLGGMGQDAKHISNAMHAIAGFELHSLKLDVLALATKVTQNADSNTQDLCSVAWSLAVLNALTLKTFDLIVGRVQSVADNMVSEDQALQLQQALWWLQPASHMPLAAHKGWQKSESRLQQCIGPVTVSRVVQVYELDALAEVLGSLKLKHSYWQLPSSKHRAIALQSSADSSTPVLLVVASRKAYFTNQPDRLVGSANFGIRLTARHGSKLIIIPWNHLNMESVKAKLEEASGLPLDQAFAFQ